VADIPQIMQRLVEACEKELGHTPVRIVVEPNGQLEVNGRVALRGETHPHVFFRRRKGEQ
jgi:hypothetical protein